MSQLPSYAAYIINMVEEKVLLNYSLEAKALIVSSGTSLLTAPSYHLWPFIVQTSMGCPSVAKLNKYPDLLNHHPDLANQYPDLLYS